MQAAHDARRPGESIDELNDRLMREWYDTNNQDMKLKESSVYGTCCSGGILAAGSTRGLVTAWELEKEGCPVACVHGGPRSWDAGVGRIYNLAVGEGVLVVAGDEGVSVAPWDVAARAGSTPKIYRPPGKEDGKGGVERPAETNAVVLAPGGFVAGDGDGVARKWDLEAAAVVASAAGHAGGILAMCDAPEAGLVATASRDGTAALLDFRTPGAVVRKLGDGRVLEAARAAGCDLAGRGEANAIWCDPLATMVTVGGGVPAESGLEAGLGGFLATFHGASGSVVRQAKTKAPIKVFAACGDELLSGGDECYVTSWPLRSAEKFAPLRRRCTYLTGWDGNTKRPYELGDIIEPVDLEGDAIDAVFSLTVTEAPGLCARHGIMCDDDYGGQPVVIAAGAAPYLEVTVDGRTLESPTLAA
mmetsp:Transcript_28045/g.84050  ORF Transcript_28045/g.84050 Transcript_28045/m.84050 type:complete len:417 (-) Transcript_28045:34-1284(-)